MSNDSLPTEIWKPVVGWEDLYQCSNFGRIKSMSRNSVRYRNGIRMVVPIPERILQSNTSQITLSRDGYKACLLRKRVIAEAFFHFEQNMSSYYIHQIDGDITNCKLDNLHIVIPEYIDDEIWKPVKGFEHFYCISNYGRLKHLEYEKEYTKCNTECHFSRVQREHILKLTPNSDGYYSVELKRDDGSKYRLIHRLVAEAFIPNYQNFPEVNHKDGNKQNNCVSNLEWCTTLYNVQHSISEHLRGSQIGIDRSRKAIKCLSDGNTFQSCKACSEFYNIHRSHIVKACREHSSYNGLQFRYLKDLGGS